MSIKKGLLEEIRYEDLPEEFKLVADSCGMEVAKTLINELGGIRISIPMAKSIRTAVKRLVLARSGTVPLKKIAIELGCSESTLEKL